MKCCLCVVVCLEQWARTEGAYNRTSILNTSTAIMVIGISCLPWPFWLQPFQIVGECIGAKKKTHTHTHTRTGRLKTPDILTGRKYAEVLTGRRVNTRGSYRESVNPRPLPAGQLTTTLIRLDKTQHVKAKSKLQAKYDQT